jgi:uncharacterized radical SAM superfamily protein
MAEDTAVVAVVSIGGALNCDGAGERICAKVLSASVTLDRICADIADARGREGVVVAAGSIKADDAVIV